MNEDQLVQRLTTSISIKDESRFEKSYKVLLEYTKCRENATAVLLDIASNYEDYIWISECIENVV